MGINSYRIEGEHMFVYVWLPGELEHREIKILRKEGETELQCKIRAFNTAWDLVVRQQKERLHASNQEPTEHTSRGEDQEAV